ncbi:MAG TPA: hypothetical protein VHX61_09165 [Rhizomicrobium sp.]|jgi:hypothetical protein|nr:hypothetical protein [Rhizomicrobium sp.]
MGTNLLYNVTSVAGLAVGQTITAADIPSGTIISNIGTVTVRPAGAATVATVGGVTTVTLPGTASTIGMAAGMAVSDYLSYPSCAGGTPAGLLNAGGYTIVPGSITATSFQITPALTAGATNDCITVSGGNTIALSQPTTGTGNSNEAVTVYNGLYRMIGALYAYTNPTSGAVNVIPFAQDNDTFYLASPALDVNEPRRSLHWSGRERRQTLRVVGTLRADRGDLQLGREHRRHSGGSFWSRARRYLKYGTDLQQKHVAGHAVWHVCLCAGLQHWKFRRRYGLSVPSLHRHQREDSA